jgi:hypothetical protein
MPYCKSSFVSVCAYRTGEKKPPADEQMVYVTPVLFFQGMVLFSADVLIALSALEPSF